MNFIEWIPSITTTSGLALVIWLSRNLIITRLTNSVRHEYDKKLEELKSILRTSEDSFKDDLKKKSDEIESLRHIAFTSVINHQTAFNERKVNAVEQLWQAVIDLAPAKATANIVSRLNMDVIEKEMGHQTEKGKTFLRDISRISGAFDLKNLPKNNAPLTRPFISLYAWSLYSAYQAIIVRANLQLILLKEGIGTKHLDNEHVIQLIEAALPHQKALIDKYGPDAAYYLLEELESLILKELSRILRGENDDKENIKRAALILNEVNKVNEENNAPIENDEIIK